MKRFFSVIKPGIIFGNIVTLCGGFFLSPEVMGKISLLPATLIGMSLVIASGCVFNNYIDRDIDPLMERTRGRVLAQGAMSGLLALSYATVLGLLGFWLLWRYTNLLTLLLAVIGFVFYVGVYSLAFKRHSVHGTAIGGIAGAIPPVVGYCAVTNRLDIGALILFLILFCWQMPHSYAIAIYRLKDYTAAAIPVLPVRKGIAYTKKSMLAYIIIFLPISLLPTFFGYMGWLYLSLAMLLGLIWIYLAVKGFRTADDTLWARKLFLFSVINITLLFATIVIKNLLFLFPYW